MSSQAPRISVVICSYNRADYIINAIDSLARQTARADQFEVIVVDNNSKDNTESLVLSYIEQHPEIDLAYVLETRQGASYARNTGAAKSRGQLLCFMDDDAVADKEYLERILRFFDEHPEAAGLGGRIIPLFIPKEPAWMSHHVASLVGNFDYAKEQTVFAPGKYPLESNMIVQKALFDAIGGFNTALPGVVGTLRIGGEGKDFFLRLQALRKPIYYHPQVIVHHVVEVAKLTREYMYRVASGIGRGERVRMLALGQWAFIKKIIEYLYKLAGSVVLGTLYAAQGKPQQFAPVVRFRIDALKGLLGK
ncbi:MAG TPA: glycosyltransferase [Flavisolibacter sp.]|jgi:glycosyltransferase involved in cell wall biosynthesis|nr:glycosyltransferase [Flavisolibacter sp.]